MSPAAAVSPVRPAAWETRVAARSRRRGAGRVIGRLPRCTFGGPGRGGCSGRGGDKTGRGRSRGGGGSYEGTPGRAGWGRGRPADRSQGSTDAGAEYRARPSPGG